MSHFFKISSDWTKPAAPANKATEPNYKNCTVKNHVTMGKYHIYDIVYHECGSYAGRKIAVYECKLPDNPDPHFVEDQPSPIARFEPTDKGWDLALQFVVMLCRIKL
jgi:hypothetical protein